MASKKVSELLKTHYQLLNIFRCYDDLNKNRISQLINQSWPTIEKAIKELKGAGILSQEEKEDYKINSDFGYYVGLSVGGSQIKLSITDMSFHALSRDKFQDYTKKYKLFQGLDYLNFSSNNSEFGYVYTKTPNNIADLQTVLDDLLSSIIKLDEQIYKNENKSIYGIGLAFTGAIDNRLKRIIKAFSLNCFTNLPLSYDTLIFDKRLSYFITNNINITIDNIAKSAIVSEKFALYDVNNPNARYFNKRNIACMYMGSGYGGALIFDNILYRATSNFTELGHIDIIDPPDFRQEDYLLSGTDECCSCGGSNCLEHKIRKYVFSLSYEDFRSYSANRLKEYFYDRFNEESGEREKRLKLLAFYIGQAMKTLINILNIDLIVLTGKLTVFMDDLSRYLYEEKSKNPIAYTNSDCSMVTSTYGALAPSIGAAITSSFPDDANMISWK